MALRPHLATLIAISLITAACAASDDPSPTNAEPSQTTMTSEPSQTTPSIDAEPSTTTAEVTTDRGTREAPVAPGDTVRVGDWDVTVLSATSDATAAVLAENEFNEPPADGHQFYVVELSVTYQGNESEAPFVGLTITSVGDSAVAYDAFEAYCGVIPSELDTFSEVFPGGTQTGNLCWSVRSSDADSLVLIVDNAFSFDQDRAYMALR
jgi:hypothetical protein